eukprot:2320929-Pyramimonas_sp.AAC.1
MSLLPGKKTTTRPFFGRTATLQPVDQSTAQSHTPISSYRPPAFAHVGTFTSSYVVTYSFICMWAGIQESSPSGGGADECCDGGRAGSPKYYFIVKRKHQSCFILN